MGWMSTRSQPDYSSATGDARKGVTTARALLTKPLKITSVFGTSSK